MARALPKIDHAAKDSDGWWVILNPGWKIPHENTHAAHESRKADAVAAARGAVPCNCDECRELLGKKPRVK